jgi:hypothetical protein
MKNHFIIPYYGNKREEAEKLYNLINLDNINIIVEPFCGSCAISYYISVLHPKKYKYILNDYNKLLIDLLNIMKDDNKMIEFENKYNNYIDELNKIKIEKERKELYLKLINTNDVYSYFISNKIYNIHPRLFCNDKDKNGNLIDYKKFYFKDYPIYNFFKNEDIELNNLEGITIYNKYKTNKNALIFIDPPYISLNNSFYNSGGLTGNLNIYEYLANNKIDKEKAKIYLILENNWIIRLIFIKYIKEENDKIYQTTKKNYKHLTISNIK